MQLHNNHDTMKPYAPPSMHARTTVHIRPQTAQTHTFLHTHK